MKPEHEKLIEAMARYADDCLGEPEDALITVTDALEFAAKQGYVLAKLPEGKESIEGPEPCRKATYRIIGWNECLRAIETIELEDENGND